MNHRSIYWCLRLVVVWAVLVTSQLAAATEQKTQVYVLGMIHGGHRTSETWGVDEVAATIRAIDPDVICTEIPPANWPSTLATWHEKHIVEDSRVKVFPEYVDVLMPLIDELGFVVEPCAGWTKSMATARRAKMQEFDTAVEYAEARAAYEKDEAWVADWLATHPAPSADDDPFYIHSPAYDLRTKAELGSYEFHLNEVIGPPGGWRYINEEHFKLIAAAITKHAGKRILITFGAGHKYWFLEQLREMPEVELIDVRAYLPGANEMSEEKHGEVIEDFLVGFDDLRAWWSPNRGDSGSVWARIAARLVSVDEEHLLAKLKATENQGANSFRNEPFLGAISVADGADRAVVLRAEVLRLGESLGQGEQLIVSVVADGQNPGLYTWSDLTLPSWLLETAP